MPEIPQPEDLFLQFLVWIGLPSISIALIQGVFAGMGWISFGSRTLKSMEVAKRNTQAMVGVWGRTLFGNLVKTVLAGGGLMALMYFAAQVADFVLLRNLGGAPTTVATISDLDYVLSMAFDYDRWRVIHNVIL